MTYEWGRIVVNTFGDLYLTGVDLLKVKGRVTFVVDLGYFSVAVRLRG